MADCFYCQFKKKHAAFWFCCCYFFLSFVKAVSKHCTNKREIASVLFVFFACALTSVLFFFFFLCRLLYTDAADCCLIEFFGANWYDAVASRPCPVSSRGRCNLTGRTHAERRVREVGWLVWCAQGKKEEEEVSWFDFVCSRNLRKSCKVLRRALIVARRERRRRKEKSGRKECVIFPARFSRSSRGIRLLPPPPSLLLSRPFISL